MTDWVGSGSVFDDGGAFPKSCCVSMTLLPCNLNISDPDNIHSMGCLQTLTDFISEQLLIVAAIAITFVIGEVYYTVPYACSQLVSSHFTDCGGLDGILSGLLHRL